MKCPNCGAAIAPSLAAKALVGERIKANTGPAREARRKLTEAQREEIRASGEPRKVLADRYGVSVTLVGMVQRGER